MNNSSAQELRKIKAKRRIKGLLIFLNVLIVAYILTVIAMSLASLFN